MRWHDWLDEPDQLCSPPPVIARPVGLGSLGSNSYFVEPYRIRSPHRIHIGRDVAIGDRSVLSVVEEFKGVRHDPVLRIGDGCSIAPDLFVACVGEIDIGPHVTIGVRVFIADSFRDYEDPERATVDMAMDEPAPVRIGAGVTLGPGSMVLAGVAIGERAVVCPGAVVTRNVPPRSVVAGNPARGRSLIVGDRQKE